MVIEALLSINIFFLTPNFIANEGLENPESTYVLAVENPIILVSNIAGSPLGKDGRGWISQYDLSGHLLKEKWIKNIDAPKGMRHFKNNLWVSNIDEVVKIDIKAGKISKRIKIDGSKFLNDIAIDESGKVYVSDTLGSAIYVIENDHPRVFVMGPEYDAPNGLFIDGNNLFVASWGLPKADWSTDKPGKLYSLNLETKAMASISKRFGNLDGLEMTDRDTFVVSDWMAGKIWTVNKTGNTKLLISGIKNSADIGFIETSGVKNLIVPSMATNELYFFTLNKVGSKTRESVSQKPVNDN